MALNDAVLAQAIVDEIKAVKDVQDETALQEMALAFAKAINGHLKSNAVVAMAANGVDTNGDTLVTNAGVVT